MLVTNWLRGLVYRFGCGFRRLGTPARLRRTRRSPWRTRHLVAAAYAPEPLEARTLLAITSAVLDSGNLTITTDNLNDIYTLVLTADNTVQVSDSGGEHIDSPFGPVTGTLTFTGGTGNDLVALDLNGFNLDADVVFNTGAGIDSVTVEDGGTITGNVTIDAGSSTQVNDDSVLLNGITINGNVSISAGDGNDSLQIQGVGITGDVAIDGGDATFGNANYIDVDDAAIDGQLTLTGGVGDDDISIDNTGITGDVTANLGGADVFNAIDMGFDAGPVTVGGNLTITAGDDDDEAFLVDVDITGNASINTGNAATYDAVSLDTVTVDLDLAITTGDGNRDLVNLTDLNAGGHVTVNTGDGGDDVQVDPTTVAGDLTINTGGGDDDVFIEQTSVTGNLAINTGMGEDYVYLNAIDVDVDLTINGGDGTKEVIMNNVAVTGSATFTSGTGASFLTADNTTVGQDVTITSVDGNVDIQGLDPITSTAGSFNVHLMGAGNLLTVGTGLFATIGDISLRADDMNIVDALSAEIVTLQQSTAGRPIEIATIPQANTLGLSNVVPTGELNQISADVVRIGDPANSGNITISSLLTGITDFDTLALRTAGAIVDNLDNTMVGGLPDIEIANLALEADQSVGVGGMGALELAVNTLNFGSSGEVHVENDGPLTISTVDQFTTSSAGGGSVTANSPLTIADDVNLTDSFTFTAGESAMDDDHLAINSDATVSLTSGTPATLTLNAGDDVEFGAEGGPGVGNGQVVTSGAAHTVNVNADTEGDAVADAYRGLIRQGQAVASVITQDLNLSAAGGIGIAGAEFIFDSESLTSASTGGGISGDQFLSEADSVDVTSIDAGTADVNLLGGVVLVSGLVSAGHVAVGSGSGSGAATLGGNGTVDAPSVTVHHLGSSIAPGESAGILNIVSGHLTLVGPYEVELGGTSPGIGMGFHDQLNVTGGVELENGLLNVQFIDGFTPNNGDTFIIINNDASDVIDGPFVDGDTLSQLQEGDILVVDGQPLQITYMGGDGNDVALTKVAFASGGDLEVTKDDTPDLVDPGGEITYTINVTNHGPQAATNVTLTDAVPGNTTFVSFTEEAGWTVSMEPSVGSTGTVQATIASFPSGETATFTLVVKVDDDAEASLITNVASVQSDDDPAPGNNSSTETTDLTPPEFDFGDAPDTYATLDASGGAKHKIVSPTPFLGAVPPDIDADGQPTAGADGDDTDGDGDDEDGVAGLNTPLTIDTMHEIMVTVDDGGGTAVLNAWLDFNADGDWDDPGEQVFTDEVLASGTHSLMIDVPADAALGDTFARFRYSTETGLDPTGRTDDGEVEDYILTIVPPIPLIDLIVEKSESADPVIAGSGAGNLTYTVTLTNDGPSDAAEVAISEELSLQPGVSFVSATPSLGTFNPTGPGADGTWTIDLLPAGQSETLTIVLTAGPSTADGAIISNKASVASIGADQLLINEGDDSATESTTVERQVDLVVSKTESADPIVAGTGNLTYTVTVTNAGPSNASGVVVNEDVTLPAGTSLVSTTPSQGTFTPTSGPDGTWDVGSLASGASATLTVAIGVSLDADNEAVISNKASVTSANEALINTGNDSFMEKTTVKNTLGNLELNVTSMINEGGEATLTGSFLNEPQSHTVTINWGDGESNSLTLSAGDFSFSEKHKYLDDIPSGTTQDPFTVVVTVSDAASATVVGNTTLVVKNVAPTFTSLSVEPTSVQSGGQTTISGTYSDPGTPDTHLIDLDLNNDGTFEQLGNPVSGGSFSFNIAVNQPPGDRIINLRIRDDDTGSSTSTLNITVTPALSAVVLDSRLFYNNSSFDGNNPAANAADVDAIDTTKVPVGIGQVATFASISGYSKGINGVTFLVSDLPDDGANLTAADFAIRVGTTNNVNSWIAGPSPSVVVLADSGPDGEDRVLLTVPGGSIVDTYAEFQMLATANTGLAQVHRAIFGNVRGDTGAAFVGQGQFFGRDAADLQAMAQPGVLFQPAGVASVTDVTKDAVTNAFDFQGVAVPGISSNVLAVITPGLAAVPAPGFAAAAVDDAVAEDEVDQAASLSPTGGDGPTAAMGDGRVGASGGTEDEVRELAFAAFTGGESANGLIGALATDRLMV